MVAVGATCVLMNLNTQTFEDLIRNMFMKKAKVVDMNITALYQRIPIDAREIKFKEILN